MNFYQTRVDWHSSHLSGINMKLRFTSFLIHRPGLSLLCKHLVSCPVYKVTYVWDIFSFILQKKMTARRRKKTQAVTRDCRLAGLWECCGGSGETTSPASPLMKWVIAVWSNCTIPPIVSLPHPPPPLPIPPHPPHPLYPIVPCRWVAVRRDSVNPPPQPSHPPPTHTSIEMSDSVERLCGMSQALHSPNLIIRSNRCGEGLHCLKSFVSVCSWGKIQN